MSAEGHPTLRLTETEVYRQLLALFASIRVEDADSRQWFIAVIRARAIAGKVENKQYRDEIKRQHEQVETKAWTRLEMRIAAEVTQEEYASKRAELHDRQAALRVQLEVSEGTTVK